MKGTVPVRTVSEAVKKKKASALTVGPSYSKCFYMLLNEMIETVTIEQGDKKRRQERKLIQTGMGT